MLIHAYSLLIQCNFAAHIIENNYVGSVVLQLTASDVDENENSIFDYVITTVTCNVDVVSATTGNTSFGVKSRDLFHINSRGVISASITFDRERCAQCRLTVLAVDRGLPAQTGSTVIDVMIDDSNDEIPMFVSAADGITKTINYSFQVYENNSPGGTPIGSVMARDLDATIANNRIQYSFVTMAGQSLSRTWDKFVLDSDTGDIYTSAPLDRETQSVYVVKVAAFDTGQPRPMTSTATVVIHVDDVNDNDPVIVYPSLSNGSLTVSNRVPVGHPMVRVVAHDSDSGRNAQLTYRLVQHASHFRIESENGVLFVTSKLTDEAEYQLVVVVSDSGREPRSASAALAVRVNSSLPFPVHAAAGDVIMSPAEVVRFGLIMTGVGVLLVLLVVVVVFIKRWTICCQVRGGGSTKARRRLAAVHMLTSGDFDRKSELIETSPSATVKPL